MTGVQSVAWSLVVLCLVMAGLGLKAWKTIREGRSYQDRLARLPNDEIHRFLSAPRGDDPSHPADILYRLNALLEIERRQDPRLVPLFIRLLSDPHPSVVKVCHEALREATGEDFRDARNDTEPDPAAWRAWWEARQAPQ